MWIIMRKKVINCLTKNSIRNIVKNEEKIEKPNNFIDEFNFNKFLIYSGIFKKRTEIHRIYEIWDK